MFDKIKGIKRKENKIYISSEYYDINFHVNEIEHIYIIDINSILKAPDDLPLRHAQVVFQLKSGRKRSLHTLKLTKRKYNRLLKLVKQYVRPASD